MAAVTVRVPNDAFNGELYGVAFRDGAATLDSVDDAERVEHFVAAGFVVETEAA